MSLFIDNLFRHIFSSFTSLISIFILLISIGASLIHFAPLALTNPHTDGSPSSKIFGNKSFDTTHITSTESSSIVLEKTNKSPAIASITSPSPSPKFFEPEQSPESVLDGKNHQPAKLPIKATTSPTPSPMSMTPESSTDFDADISNLLYAQLNTLRDEYSAVEIRFETNIDEISLNKQEELDRAITAFNREMGRRGIGPDSGIYHTELQQITEDIHSFYDSQISGAEFERDQELRLIQSEIDSIIFQLE